MSFNKIKILTIIICLTFLKSFSQDLNDCEGLKDRLTNLIEANYKDLPVDGAKYVLIKGCRYIIGVGTTSIQSKNNSVMARISSVKARREILLLLNSTSVTSKSILTTEQIIKDDSISYFEGFRDEVVEKASGFVNGMPMLTSFKSSDGSTFIYVVYKII